MRSNSLSIDRGGSVLPIRVDIINRIMSSPIWIPVLAVLTCLAFAYSKEFEFYCFVIAYATLVALFADDLSPLIPLFVFCYIAPSAQNNPGVSEESIFYGESGLTLLLLVSVAVVIIFARIGFDEDMGFSRLFGESRELTLGMIALGAAYMLSGIGSEHYEEYALKNIFFAFIQFMSIFLLYFILSGTVNWSIYKPSYLALTGVCMGLIVAFELGYLYFYGDVIVDGEIFKENIYTGWGISNNLGAMLTMAIPFPFYFACKYRFSAPAILTSVLLLAAVFFTASRTAAIFAVIIFIVSLVYAFFKSENRVEMAISSLIILFITITIVLLYVDKLGDVFARVMQMVKADDNAFGINDSGRLSIYKDGLRAFRDAPFLGQTFYPIDYSIFDFSSVDAFSSFFPPRWHNTIVQVLASCGSVGIAAYIFHRASTVMTFIKHRNTTNTFIAFSILGLIGMSLLDCHFFNVGPVLFYSIMLAVIEFSEEEDCFSLV